MKNEFVLAFNEVLEEKQLPKDIILEALRHALISAYRRAVNASNAQFEAMSLGKVVLGSTNSSFDEVIIDSINGFLFINGDPEDLANKMIEIYQRSDLNEIGIRAKETMEKDYNQDLVINEILKYYQGIL